MRFNSAHDIDDSDWNDDVLPDRLHRLLLGRRLGPWYVGICTRTQGIAVLHSGRGTYCAWHRAQRRRQLRNSRHDTGWQPIKLKPGWTSAWCPKWGDLGHNWIRVRGWLPWRIYRICTGCGYQEREHDHPRDI